MNASTYDDYRLLAERRPVKALRYRTSITETLSHDIGQAERARLTEALRGLRDGLHASNHCTDCGRALTDGDSIAAGVGPVCAHKAERRAS